MVYFLSLLPMAIIGALYVWFLRLSAKWILKISLSLKLAWGFFAAVIALIVLNKAFLPHESTTVTAVVGVTMHLVFGAAFFGRLAVDREGKSPGFIGGLKMIATAMGLLAVLLAFLFLVQLFVLEVPSS